MSYPIPSRLEHDPELLREVVETIMQATLLVPNHAATLDSFIPMVPENESGPITALIGHLPAINPQCELLDGTTVTAYFHGPHGYVSPFVYEKMLAPTWDFVNVKVVGRCERVDDTAEKKQLMRRLTECFEPGEGGWRLEHNLEYTDGNLHRIVGFRLQVEHIEGRFKVHREYTEHDKAQALISMKKQNPEHTHALLEKLYAPQAKDQ